MKFPAFIIFVLGLIAQPAVAFAEEADARGIAFYESKIRPLLIEQCYSCHSAKALSKKKLKANLLVDSLSAMLTGGDLGPALVPGKPDESLLIKAVRYTDSDLKMPPKTKLSEAQISLLEQWVKMGAPAPKESGAGTAIPQATIDLEQGRRHWSIQSLLDVTPPAVSDEAWVKSPVDRFILAKLQVTKLSGATMADKATLIRRATFDLTGLPPTAQEIEAFIKDESPDAFAKVVDRLLASERYGERWGRHWLDVVRYADSNGLDENVAHGNAWRYRDYVIAAFNEDKPFDQFVMEQIAGDLMEKKEPAIAGSGSISEVAAKPRAALTATGFLALGPKVLAEVDKMKMEMDIIDEQLDTLGRAFLGQTFGCARCHDHKFDPISAADYYAMAGIFKSTTTMEDFTTIAKWWENPIPTEAELVAKTAHDEKVAAMKRQVAAAIESANAALLLRLGEAAKLPEKPETHYDEAEKAAIKKLRDELAALEKEAPEISHAMGVTEGKPTDLAIHLRGSHMTLGTVVPRRFPLVFGESRKAINPKQSGRLELARWIASKDHPLTARVMVNRVWRWHFGAGLVRTPDNFGKLGEPPTHPQLLDWLAMRFIEDGWSVKQLHRRIMLSSTYQMSSDHREDAVRIDPENRLYSRAPVRRLEAEAIRDAMLFVSGRLDMNMGGPAITHVKNREFLFDHTSKDGTKYDSLRRSVYLPVIRNHLYDFFELFDFPDSAVSQGDRPTTTVATQALLAMNSPLVWESAAKLAVELEAGGDRGLAAVYGKVLGRAPVQREVARFEAFMAGLSDGDARRAAMTMFCQALLASNEFLYVR